MSALEVREAEARAEVARLEEHDEAFGLSESGKVKPNNARIALESTLREQRRPRSEAKQELHAANTMHEAVFNAKLEALRVYVEAAEQLDAARERCLTAERDARINGVEFEKAASAREAEITLKYEVRTLVGEGADDARKPIHLRRGVGDNLAVLKSAHRAAGVILVGGLPSTDDFEALATVVEKMIVTKGVAVEPGLATSLLAV